jgi:hypothetical protein
VIPAETSDVACRPATLPAAAIIIILLVILVILLVIVVPK